MRFMGLIALIMSNITWFSVMGKYSLIYADPPWLYRVWNKKGVGCTAENHYPTMKLEEICALPVASIAAKDSVLFLWVTFPNLLAAFEVIKAWGFTYKTVAFCWIKTNRKSPGYFVSLGHWTSAKPECDLSTICVKGNTSADNACWLPKVISGAFP